jgi:hypothetical protein
MDDNTSRAHARELAKLGRAVREVREERGLNERAKLPMRCGAYP